MDISCKQRNRTKDKWLKKRNLKREIKYLLKAVENDVIKTKYVKAKVNSAQEIAYVCFVATKIKKLITRNWLELKIQD